MRFRVVRFVLRTLNCRLGLRSRTRKLLPGATVGSVRCSDVDNNVLVPVTVQDAVGVQVATASTPCECPAIRF